MSRRVRAVNLRPEQVIPHRFSSAPPHSRIMAARSRCFYTRNAVRASPILSATPSSERTPMNVEKESCTVHELP